MSDDTPPVEYEPTSVKAVLAEMKDTAELLVDLAYSAVLFNDASLADEVPALEERMDVLQLQGRMSVALAARNPDEAETLAPVLGVIGAAEKVSDAAAEVAEVVEGEASLPDAVRDALPAAAEALARATVAETSPYAGRTLGDINLETETGARVVARRREDDWALDPGPETPIGTGDVLLLRGPAAAIAEAHAGATGEPYRPPEPPDAIPDDLGRAVETVRVLKDVGELALDLAYGAILYDAPDVAREVLELEAEADALRARLEAWTLRAAADAADPVALRGVLRIAGGAETISDAALEITEGALRGLDAHPVVAAAVEASDETIVRVTVAPGSDLDGTTLAAADLRSRTGVRVVAVRRGEDPAEEAATDDREPDGSETTWALDPGPETPVRAGDVLLAKGTRTGTDRLADLTAEP